MIAQRWFLWLAFVRCSTFVVGSAWNVTVVDGENFNYQYLTRPSTGDACDVDDMWWYPVTGHPDKFAYCDKKTGIISIDICATVNGIQKLFDEAYQQCVMPTSVMYKAPGVPRSSRFGETCLYNTDCLNNMYCPAGTCLCLVGFIDVGSDCYTVINPGQSGCISRRQCESVWPGSDCEDGVCRCPKPKIPVETKDGFVCVLPGSCPLPEDSELSISPSQLSVAVDMSMPQCKMEGGTVTDENSCFDSATAQKLDDMYDCIPKDQSGKGNGICCPNRALTCILPKRTSSNLSKAVTRYWFNSATGTCEQFLWDPTYTDSNSNNFRTVDQCRSYCQTSCRRGSPEYTGVENTAKTKSCTTNSACTRNGGSVLFQCATVGARQFCCPSTDWICSPNGGRDYTALRTPDPGPASSSKTAITRWYYDSTTKICKSFSYKGEGGNFNNFHTMDECNSFCARSLCERGDPLKDSNGLNQHCTPSRGCPSTYECRQSVCCPRKQTVCIQPKMLGTCTSAISRYWYNVATRDCEQFMYTGCNGNDNNFESYLACQNYCRDVKPEPKCIQGEADKDANGNFFSCSLSSASGGTCRLNYECYFDGYMFGCCPSKAWSCSLNKLVGTACVAPTVRWFFDSNSKSCQTFTYSGCDGNSNNFQTRQQCEQYCGVGGCPFGGEPYQDSNTMQRKVCNAQSSPCPSGYECTMVTVNGSPMHYCCPTRAYICGLSPNQGSQCGNSLQKYYFNIATKVCSTFTYFGCGGNENNFATLSQCNNFCNSAACAPGESVYVDANSQKPVSCNAGSQASCPSGYTCKLDSLSSKYLCCGSADLGVCPSKEKAYIEALSQSARECQPGIAGSCPQNFLCRPNQAKNRYYCCAPDSKAVCPSGRAVYRDALTKQPQTCYIGSSTTGCPKGYTCQSSTRGVNQGFCCSGLNLCPQNREFFVEQSTGNPRQCALSSSNNFNQCPSGYECKSTVYSTRSGTADTGFCCRLPPPPASVACASGRGYEEKGVLKSCSSTQGCPNGTICTPHAATGQLFCCFAMDSPERGRSPPVQGKSSDGCPPGTTIVSPRDSDSQMCDLLDLSSCPDGSSCQFNSLAKRYQCCGATRRSPPPPAPPPEIPMPETPETSEPTDDGCPPGQIPYADKVTRQLSVCDMDEPNCPTGYSCQYSRTFQRSHCCGLQAGCPASSVAYIDGSTGRSKTCEDASDDSCPDGFSCLRSSNGGHVCCSSSGTKTRSSNNPIDVGVCPAGFPLSNSDGDRTRDCSEKTPCPTGYRCLPTKFGPTCCLSKDSVCHLPMHSGDASCPGGSTQKRFYYNAHSGSCQQFIYKGCGGNVNNFLKIADCDNFCAKGVCLRGEPARLDSSFEICRGSSGCPNGYTCSVPMYGLGEKQICCPSKESICTASADLGVSCVDDSAKGTVVRYYYDSRQRSCEEFNYRGCGGNGNNFLTTDECLDYCLQTDTKVSVAAVRCPSTRSVPWVLPGHSTPMLCRPGVQSCPMGYLCQNGGARNVFICCSVVQAAQPTPVVERGSCPRYFQPQINPTSRSPQTCVSYLDCRPNHRCLYSAMKRRGYCCRQEDTSRLIATRPGASESIASICPSDMQPYNITGLSNPLFCALGSSMKTETCPPGYSCAYSPKFRTYICCGRKAIGADDKISQPDRSTTQPIEGPRPGDRGGCRNGRAFFYPGTRSPLACFGRDTVRDSSCPKGFNCEFSTVNNQYQCCSTSFRAEASSTNRTTLMTSAPKPQTRTSPPATVRPPPDVDATIDDYDQDYRLAGHEHASKTRWSQPHSCDGTQKKSLGEECCADEQCPHGCKRHGELKLCLCQSHMILDMTRQPHRCVRTCSAWRDGGVCVQFPLTSGDRLSSENRPLSSSTKP